ncbi:STN and carboxypeptidase regulatory-like domain-containing protein [Paraflavisolibacter sp. H34]|uniref:STN and carboxypeptidase regulatory-like domain-containing protein n=1 Tax=Huijunlia imazamoxiresistens TaxID=3127457 RepID=UPI00301AD5CC
MKNSSVARKGLLMLGLFGLCSLRAAAQNLLNRVIPLEVKNQRLDQVLELLSNSGGFYFSYNSAILKPDSLVTLSARDKSLRQVLGTLFPQGYEFRESGNYLIIRRAPIRLTLVTNQAATEDRQYVVSGYVLDDLTGRQLPAASIYEKQQLVSALTNADGYFKLRLKSRVKTAALTFSKEFYQDTTVRIEPSFTQKLTITLLPESGPDITIIRPEDYFVPDSLRVRVTTPAGSADYRFVRVDTGAVETTALGNLLLSSRQKLQSLNLRKFFTDRPFQVSVVPGLSTQGKMSGQVINNVSFNVFGGYGGGVDGFELGGLFNIDKKDVQYAQIGGLLNIVGGGVNGLQVGGLNNTVLGGFNGVQIGGISNLAGRSLNGLQVGGVYNHVSRNVNGFQLAGVANFARDEARGLQVAGVANIANREMDGLQMSGVFNYAKRLKGVQIGLINLSDSSDGYSIGLINVVLHGYHKLALSANEVTPFHLGFKTGNRRLYSILQGGLNRKEGEKAYTFGYGLGTELGLARWLSLNPEISGNYLYLGAWDYANILGKGALNLNLKFGKYVSLFGGPVFNALYSNQPTALGGYRFPLPPANHRPLDLGFGMSNWTGWIGWNAGIHLF